MKTAITTVIVVAVLLVPSTNALEPGTSHIRLTQQLISSTNTVQIYALYNRPAYKRQLGTAFVNCIPINRQFNDCYESLRLARGQIVARALVPSAARFRVLAVVGGTGLYANVGGEMIVQPVGYSYQLVLIDLKSF